MSKNFLLRFCFFSLGLLCIWFFMWIAHWWHFLFLQILIVVVLFFILKECIHLVQASCIVEKSFNLWRYSLVVMIVPMVSMLYIQEILNIYYVLGIIMFIFVSFFIEIIGVDEHSFSDITMRLAQKVLILVYPILFGCHVLFISLLEAPRSIYIIYMSCVYINDIMAYIGGKLFGKKSADNIISISPKKTRIGFICGMLASIITALLWQYYEPAAFPLGFIGAICIGILMAIMVPVGDIIASALKRAAFVKDSGDDFLGRGGMLDCFDTPLFIAPIFVYGYLFLSAL